MVWVVLSSGFLLMVFFNPAFTKKVTGNKINVKTMLDRSPKLKKANINVKMRLETKIMFLITIFLRYKTFVSSVISMPLSKPKALLKNLLFFIFAFNDKI